MPQIPGTLGYRLRAWLTLTALGMLLPAMPVMADEDPWPCQVVLCLANPDGPTALEECRPPIQRAWRVWARGKRVPDCKKKNQDGSTGGSVREDGTYIENMPADPDRPGNCPFVYYAGYNKQKYCAFAGVTNEYINGELWGRIWYGGPGGVPYVEQLVETPGRPRPADGFEAAWQLLKGDIESKSDFAALAHKIWQDAERRALAAERAAAAARDQAQMAASDVDRLVLSLPALLDAAQDRHGAARTALEAATAAADAAKAAAEGSDATPTQKRQYEVLKAAKWDAEVELSAAVRAETYLRALIASIPDLRAKAAQLDTQARAVETSAAELRSQAIVAKAEFEAAELAARPLPDFAGA